MKECSVKYAPYLDKYLLFISTHNTKRDKEIKLEYFETFFGKDKFMHLVGYGRKKNPNFDKNIPCNENNKRYLNDKNAKDFFDECFFDASIDLSQYQLTEGKKGASAKLDVVRDIFNFKYVKIYQAGEKDLITQDVNFKIGLGVNQCVMGFNLFKSQYSSTYFYSPITSIKKDITEYVSKPGKILCILAKEHESDLYTHILGVPNSGLDVNLLVNNKYISKIIDPTILNLTKLNKSMCNELTPTVLREKYT